MKNEINIRTKNRKIIGIVGGVGPYAGLDLNRKIFQNTISRADKDHFDVFLLSRPQEISDRTDYLMGETAVNPAYEIYNTIVMLEKIGAEVVAIPCNTAHSPQIFDVIEDLMNKNRNKIKLLHIVKETYNYISDNFPEYREIGLLSTAGTYNSNLYKDIFEKQGKFKMLYPEIMTQKKVHDAIYNEDYGIKSESESVTQKARDILIEATSELKSAGIQAVIMGCTEIPMAINESETGIKMIDPNEVLARALIKFSDKKCLL